MGDRFARLWLAVLTLFMLFQAPLMGHKLALAIDPLRSALIFSLGVLYGAGITAFLRVMQVLLLSRRRGSNPPPPGRKPAPPPSPPDRYWRRSFNHENTNRPTSEPPCAAATDALLGARLNTIEVSTLRRQLREAQMPGNNLQVSYQPFYGPQ